MVVRVVDLLVLIMVVEVVVVMVIGSRDVASEKVVRVIWVVILKVDVRTVGTCSVWMMVTRSVLVVVSKEKSKETLTFGRVVVVVVKRDLVVMLV